MPKRPRVKHAKISLAELRGTPAGPAAPSLAAIMAAEDARELAARAAQPAAAHERPALRRVMAEQAVARRREQIAAERAERERQRAAEAAAAEQTAQAQRAALLEGRAAHAQDKDFGTGRRARVTGRKGRPRPTQLTLACYMPKTRKGYAEVDPWAGPVRWQRSAAAA